MEAALSDVGSSKRWCGLRADAIPQLTFGKGTLGVFATVAIRVTCRVDSLEADPRGRFST